jgi:hypothetical protein
LGIDELVAYADQQITRGFRLRLHDGNEVIFTVVEGLEDLTVLGGSRSEDGLVAVVISVIICGCSCVEFPGNVGKGDSAYVGASLFVNDSPESLVEVVLLWYGLRCDWLLVVYWLRCDWLLVVYWLRCNWLLRDIVGLYRRLGLLIRLNRDSVRLRLILIIRYLLRISLLLSAYGRCLRISGHWLLRIAGHLLLMRICAHLLRITCHLLMIVHHRLLLLMMLLLLRMTTLLRIVRLSVSVSAVMYIRVRIATVL